MNLNNIRKSLQKHLKKRVISLIYISLIFSVGCGGNDSEEFLENESEKYYKKELENINYENLTLLHEKEKEALFLKAIEDSLVFSKEFESLLRKAKKEIAAAMVIDRFSENLEIDTSNEVLKDYYRNHLNEFQIYDDAVVVNKADFSEYENSVQFRKYVLKYGWDAAEKVYGGKTDIVRIEKFRLIYQSDLKRKKEFRYFSTLREGELSIIFRTEHNNFSIVQLVKNLDKYAVPRFEFVKELVKNNYLVSAYKKEYNKFLDELIIKYKLDAKGKKGY